MDMRTTSRRPRGPLGFRLSRLPLAIPSLLLIGAPTSARSASSATPSGDAAQIAQCLDPGATAQASGAGPERTARLRSDFVRLPDGTRLRFVEQGDPDGETLILLHGYSDSWFSFSRLLPLLPDRYRVIALDQRGHGCSDATPGGYGMADLAADVLAFMDARGIGRATVVGHSMGSLIAQELAAAAPDRVTGIVLLDSAHQPSRIQGVVELGRMVEELPDPVPDGFIREFQLSTIYQGVSDDFLAVVMSESARLSLATWRGVVRGILEMEPRAGRVREAGVRTLLFWGDRDTTFPRDQQEALRAELPDAVYIEMAETGHAPHWERPGRVAEEIERFLQAG